MALSAEAQSLIGTAPDNRWNGHAEPGTPVVISYSFATEEADYAEGGYTGYTAYSDTQKAHVRAALDTWEAVAGITFVEVPDSAVGDIRFSMVDLTGYTNAVGGQVSGFGYLPWISDAVFSSEGVQHSEHDGWGGDIFMHAGFFAGSDGSLAPGVRGYSILLHEIGHALGFKHPFEGEPLIPAASNNGSVTVMAYNRSAAAVSLGWADVEALTYLYGNSDASLEAFWSVRKSALEIEGTRRGDAIDGAHHDNIIRAAGGADQVLGGGGRDRIFGGKGADTLYGGSDGDRLNGDGGRDFLSGGDGRDRLDGGGGADRLDGGGGKDKLTGGKGADVFVFSQSKGRDVVQDFRIGQDRIDLSGTGLDFDGLGFRKAGQNVVIKAAGADMLIRDTSLAEMMDADNFLF